VTEIRTIHESEGETFLRLMCGVFGLDFNRAYDVFFTEPLFDLDRKWALFEGNEMVSILTTSASSPCSNVLSRAARSGPVRRRPGPRSPPSAHTATAAASSSQGETASSGTPTTTAAAEATVPGAKGAKPVPHPAMIKR
jgi:hypothetical protein